jgi:hypothetical protein
VAIFKCRTCGTALTRRLTELSESEVDEAREALPAEEPAQPLLPRGTFTIDDQPFGPPHVPIKPGSNMHVSAGPIGTIILHPKDIRRVQRHTDRGRLNGCCDLDGTDGPNLVCANCGTEVATQQTDCWTSWTSVRLEPAAVTRN